MLNSLDLVAGACGGHVNHPAVVQESANPGTQQGRAHQSGCATCRTRSVSTEQLC